MLKGFRDFIMRGNIIELAIAFVMGAAFNAVVQAFATGFIGGLIGAIGGTPDFSNWGYRVNGSKIVIGTTINALINFLIVAAVIYFCLVLPMNRLAERRKRGEEAAEAPAPVTPTEELLTDIRDLLAHQNGNGTAAGHATAPRS
jgi:large conductance mechanosensitive channel